MSNSVIPIENAICNSRTIAKNFFWNGLEMLLAAISVTVVSIAVARVIGPARLGYFSLVQWSTTITALIGSLGIPVTTFKYMGEFFGSGEHALAKAIFAYSLRLQAILGSAISGVGLVLVFTIGDPAYRLISTMLVLSMLPQMLSFIPSSATRAAENVAVIFRAGVIYLVVNVGGILLSLLLHWDLTGIAATILLCRVVDLAAKWIPVGLSLRSYPKRPLPGEVRQRIFAFSKYSTALMLLQVIVMDRSDILLLKTLQPDIRQVTFFSLAFSLAERLVRAPQAFSGAVSNTQMAEYGRNKERLFGLTAAAGTYIALLAAPLLFGAAAVAGPLIRLAFGRQYLPMIPVFVLVSALAFSKAVISPAQNLLYAAEDMKFALLWTVLCGIVNIALDVLLIPSHGAMGAAWGNGIAQTLAAAGMWTRVVLRFPVKLPVANLRKLVYVAVAMCAAVVACVRLPLPEIWRLLVAITAGTLVFTYGLRRLAVFAADDRARLGRVVGLAPESWQRAVQWIFDFVFPLRAAVES